MVLRFDQMVKDPRHHPAPLPGLRAPADVGRRDRIAGAW